MSAATISVQSETPWGALEDLTEVDFGTINVNSTISSEEYRLYLTDVNVSDISVSSNSSKFTAVIDDEAKTDYDGNQYYTIVYQAITANENDSIFGTVTLTSGDASYEVSCSALVKNLNASTLADFKALTNSLNYQDEAYYTGDAVVQWVWNSNFVWVADSTGGVLLEGRFDNEEVQPGIHLKFSATKGTLRGTCNFWGVTSVTINHEDDAVGNYSLPTPKLIESALTEDNYGEYVHIKNVTLDSTYTVHPLFPRDDNMDPLWMFFKDEAGNTYVVETPCWNPYAGGIDDAWKNEELEIIGGVVGSSTDNGDPQPFIYPRVIRPMLPEEPLENGVYTMTAKSYIYEENEEWDVNVEQDEENPYIYKLTNFVKHQDQANELPIYAELSDKCDSLRILTGQQILEYGDMNAGDTYLATAPSFDRTGNTPSQEPSPKGTLINCSIDSNTGTVTILPIFDYCVYVYGWKDPESDYYDYRWSHYGIWYAGATMVFDQDKTDGIEETNIAENNQAKEVARYNIGGMRISGSTKGINIIKMSDGTTKKIIVK
jgi:hypothetical protein